MTAQQFCKVLLRSTLVDEEGLRRSLASVRVRHEGTLPEDAQTLADDLVAAGIISKWHATNLLQGRWRGFFLGRYKLIRHLGTGGMSSVYLAEHTVMNKRLAIKVLPKERLKNPTSLARFQTEARTAARLDHPNIVKTLDIDEERGQHFIVMEFIDGSDLERLVRKTGPLPIPKALELLQQAASGLQHAHERGVLHRDVKPLNMLMTQEGLLKVSDLGLARFRHEEGAQLTLENNKSILGTADYLAPEQALDSHNVDGRADLYSLGCTFYFMMTGRPPYAEGTLAQRIAKHQMAPAPDLLATRPDSPPEIVGLYQKLMAKRPEERFQTASELLVVIQRLRAMYGASPNPMAMSGFETVSTSTGSTIFEPNQEPAGDPLFSEGGFGSNPELMFGGTSLGGVAGNSGLGSSGLGMGAFPMAGVSMQGGASMARPGAAAPIRQQATPSSEAERIQQKQRMAMLLVGGVIFAGAILGIVAYNSRGPGIDPNRLIRGNEGGDIPTRIIIQQR